MVHDRNEKPERRWYVSSMLYSTGTHSRAWIAEKQQQDIDEVAHVWVGALIRKRDADHVWCVQRMYHKVKSLV